MDTCQFQMEKGINKCFLEGGFDSRRIECRRNAYYQAKLDLKFLKNLAHGVLKAIEPSVDILSANWQLIWNLDPLSRKSIKSIDNTAIS